MYSSMGSQLQKQITPRIFEKFAIVSGRAYWDQDKLFYEKNQGRSTRDTVPLNAEQGDLSAMFTW
jgi:hypothetical protein